MLLQCVLSVAKGVRLNALSLKHTHATAVGIQVAAFRYRQTQVVPKTGPKTKTRRLENLTCALAEICTEYGEGAVKFTLHRRSTSPCLIDGDPLGLGLGPFGDRDFQHTVIA